VTSDLCPDLVSQNLKLASISASIADPDLTSDLCPDLVSQNLNLAVPEYFAPYRYFDSASASIADPDLTSKAVNNILRSEPPSESAIRKKYHYFSNMGAKWPRDRWVKGPP
jgi:hypothetical protein